MVIGVVAGFLGALKLLGLDVILDKEVLFTYTVSAIIYYIVRKLYYIAFTYTSGQTVGKKIFRIKVVNDDKLITVDNSGIHTKGNAVFDCGEY